MNTINKYNAQKFLKRIKKVKLEIKNSLKKKIDFQDAHTETLNLCRLVLPSSEYKHINVQYPFIVNLIRIINPKNKKNVTDIVPIRPKEQIEKLGLETLELLKKMEDIFNLKIELQEDNLIIKELNKIKNDIKLLRK